MKRIFAIIMMTILFLTVAGCSKEPQPEDRFAAYIKLWNAKEFDEMYGYLTADAQKTITKKEFIERYQKIYKDLNITELQVSFKKPKEEKKEKMEKVDYNFNAKMNSVAGEINFTHSANLIKEEKDKNENWFVNWDTTFIFPELKEGDKISLSNISAKRGEIVDRNENAIAMNGLAYEIGVVPEKMGEQKAEYVGKLATLLKMAPEQIEKALNASWVQPGFFVPLKKISMDDQELVQQLIELEPVQTKKVEARLYPLHEVAAHLIGYVGQVTAEDLEKQKGKGYSSTDVIGKKGLEKVFEEQLKGTNGVKITIKKEDGNDVLLAEKPVEDGEKIQLTIDIETQQKAFAELAGEAGTAAVIHPLTGETLALASSPSFDPAKVAFGLSATEWKALEEDKQKPFTTRFNKPYAPGSVMKPITAAIGLKNGAITPEKKMDIKTLKWQKDKSWGKYFVTRVHESKGPVNLETALVASDNIYFAQTALAIGKDALATGLKEFGFEEEIPYSYPLEQSKIGKLESEITLADSGYGQGQIEMSMVHLLTTYTPFVNGGKMVKPTLLLNDEKSQAFKGDVMTAETATVIANSLRKVVADSNGTAHAIDIPGYSIAGKTGTAELKLSQTEKGTENGWFVGYNSESPNLMIGMMIEGVEDRGGSQIPVKKVKNLFLQLKP